MSATRARTSTVPASGRPMAATSQVSTPAPVVSSNRRAVSHSSPTELRAGGPVSTRTTLPNAATEASDGVGARRSSSGAATDDLLSQMFTR